MAILKTDIKTTPQLMTFSQQICITHLFSMIHHNFREIAKIDKYVTHHKLVGFYGPIAPPVPNAIELRSLHAAAPPVQ